MYVYGKCNCMYSYKKEENSQWGRLHLWHQVDPESKKHLKRNNSYIIVKVAA